MAMCLDCNSVYDTPGTCNCFAPGGRRAPGTWYGTTLVPESVYCPQCGQMVFPPHACWAQTWRWDPGPATHIDTGNLYVNYDSMSPTDTRKKEG